MLMKRGMRISSKIYKISTEVKACNIKTCTDKLSWYFLHISRYLKAYAQLLTVTCCILPA